MTDFETFVRAMDRCWLERRFDDLKDYLAGDIVIRAPTGARVEGRDAAVGSYRDFMSRAQVGRFDTADFACTLRGDAAIVEYLWDMGWSDQGADHTACGREILVIVRRDGVWRVVWRTQLPA